MSNLILKHKPQHGSPFRSASQKAIDAKMQTCLAMDDNDGAVSCIKAAVKEAQTTPRICQPKLVLFTQPGCEVCDKERKRLQDDIKSGLVEEVSVATPAGAVIAKRNGVEATPDVLLMDCQNNVIEPSAK